MGQSKERVLVQCACNCGQLLENLDAKGRPRKYIRDHQTKVLVLYRKRPYGPSPTKGRKASAETRRKLSESHMGQVAWNKGKVGTQIGWNKGKKMGPRPLSIRLQISAKLKGENSHLWRGGVIHRNDYLATVEWRDLRKVAYKRDNWKCTVCGKAPGKALQAHHIIPVRHGGAVLDLENVASVCMACHKREELRYGKPHYKWADKVAEHQKMVLHP